MLTSGKPTGPSTLHLIDDAQLLKGWNTDFFFSVQGEHTRHPQAAMSFRMDLPVLAIQDVFPDFNKVLVLGNESTSSKRGEYEITTTKMASS
jgi:hypothetical protein